MDISKLSFIGSLVVIIFLSFLLLSEYYHYYYHYVTSFIAIPAFAIPHTIAPPTQTGPTILNDTHLKIETISEGLDSPTSMAFMGQDDILVLEKDKGTVQRIIDGKMIPEPLLKVPVATKVDRGMLGIAIAKHEDEPTYVFLYYTQSGGGKNGDDRAGIQPLRNRVYRYELDNDHDKLINPKLLVSLPTIPRNQSSPETNDNGGTVRIGPDIMYIL